MTERGTATSTTNGSRSADVDGAEQRDSRVLWLLLVATFVVILNETIMSVAITDIMRDFHVDARAGQWLTTAFMLTLAVVIPITGILLQRFSTRSMFIAAMSLFSAGTLIAATAPVFGVLLAARVVQASGTAIMMPLLMTTIMTVVAPGKRGRTMGNVSIVISVAPAIGPTIAGIILSALQWRWIFWFVLPIAVVMLVVGALRVRNVSTPAQVPIDVLSVVLSVFGFGGLVYGLSQIGATDQSAGAGSMPMILAFVVGGGALIWFVLRQLLLQRKDRALLDLRTFGSSTFTVTIVLMAISMAALLGTVILLPIFMQQVLGLEPLAIGLLLLPGGLIMGLLAPLVGRLYDRVGARPLVIPGAIAMSAALWMLAFVGSATPPWYLLTAHVVLSIGLAFLFTPLFTAGLGAVPERFYSHGSAIIGTVQQVAGAAGTALFVAVMSVREATVVAAGSSVREATASGIGLAFFVGGVLSLGAVLAAFFVRTPATAADPHDALADAAI
ncbi:multidrug efflux MFS transporter [Planctomonas sp. JC2975]|uniref:DHA2 family efflux MFS transporter permease subunit n=1 Tax=Planctomonas sp. JC2975 TaxID=2729626 RepID=UPI001474B264|nr:DHA2 family efflux MFS transporter permease subunit [Planctomonas sp. JC2975]NNC11350.1 multidrug efflux MFS transporter [Planctomonas sp. JC2975]